MLPGEVAVLVKLGVSVLVEAGAGALAWAADREYVAAGASVTDRKELISGSGLLLSVNPPLEDNPDVFAEGQILCSVVNPAENREWLEKEIKPEIQRRFPRVNVILQIMSMTSAVHMGPGTWGIAFLQDPTGQAESDG